MDVLKFLKNAVITGEKTADYYNKPNKRDLYYELIKPPRMHIIYGLRGGGKTTLLFQIFKNYRKEKRIYFSGDEIKLLNLSLLEIFNSLDYVIDLDGAVFLDEITQINNWEKELKIIYDKFPKLNLFVSGSSTINLIESKRILARRAKYHHLLPMTFREFLKIKYNIEIKKFDLNKKDLFKNALKYEIYFKNIVRMNPIKLVEEYALKNQPFLLEADETMLMDLMDKIIYEDILKAYSFEKEIINKFHRLIFLLAMSEKITYDNLSKDLSVSKGVIGEMIRALINSGIIKAVLPYGSGRVVGRKTWRYLFLIPAIRNLYLKKGGADESIRKGFIREDLVVSHMDNVFYLPYGPDFVYRDFLIEVGGQYKKTEQFRRINLNKTKLIVYEGSEVERLENITKLPLYIFLSSF